MSFHCDRIGDMYIVVKRNPAFKDSESRESFNDQAPEIFRLEHENVVRTYAIVESGDFIRILMEPLDSCLENLRVQVSLFSSVAI